MVYPINSFTVHNLIGFMVTGSLAAMFYIVYFRAGRRLLDLLAANFILCAAGLCLDSFLTDNLIPAGMSSFGWERGPTAEQLRISTLEIQRYGWVFAIMFLPTQLHFVLHYCQKHNFVRRHIRVAYVLAAIAVPTVWTDLWITAPDAPLAETSSWGVTIPWFPEIGPAAPMLFLCGAAMQIYALVLLWRTRRLSLTEFAYSLAARRIVFAAFVVQIVAGLGDVFASAVSVPIPGLSPVGAGIMGVLLSVALIRSRIEADKARFQLESEKAALLECVPQPLFYFGQDSKVQWANSGAAAFSGEDPDELVGRATEDILGAAGRELVPEELTSQTNQPAVREIVRDEATWMVHASPVKGVKGQREGAIVLAMDITEIRQAQEALRQSNVKILMAREEERRRVAQDLHDSVAQGLTALQMQLHANAAKVAKDAPEREKFDQASQRAGQIGTEVRQISHQLYPPALDLLGLVMAVEDIFEQYRASGIECCLDCAEDLRKTRYSQDVEVALYRTVQEAISNAIRHGKARTINVQFHRSGDEIQLTVNDDGGGFDVQNNRHGLGMSSMKSRVEGIGGRLDISSRPGRTSVAVSVPLDKCFDAARTADAAADEAEAVPAAGGA